MTKRLSAPLEKLELTIDNSDFITYFSRDFHCLDLRKMNKDCESAKETIIIKKNVHLSCMTLTWTSLVFLDTS